MRQKFFIDVDEVLVQSAKAFCEVYNQRYQNHPQFKYADYKLNMKWDFSDICNLLQKGEVDDIFSSKELFNNLEPYPYSVDTLEKYKDMYDFIIVSIGTRENLSHKMTYLEQYFPMIQDLILLNTKHLDMNKSLIDMSGKDNIFLDDHQKNLNSIKNIDHKILFKPMGVKEWNNEWNGAVVTDWLNGVDTILYYTNENFEGRKFTFPMRW